MASIEAIGIKKELATKRIEGAVEALAAQFGLDLKQFDLHPFDHNREYRQAMQLEAFAALLEHLVEAVTPPQVEAEGASALDDNSTGTSTTKKGK